MQILQLLLFLIIAGILITLLVLCKKYVLHRCCNCFKALLAIIMGKLMFNAILRTLMQTFLKNSINMWYSLFTTDVSSLEGILDLVFAVLLLALNIMFPIFCYKFLKKKFNEL